MSYTSQKLTMARIMHSMAHAHNLSNPHTLEQLHQFVLQYNLVVHQEWRRPHK